MLHALLVEGTMETVSKAALSTLAVVAAAKLAIDLRIWAIGPARRPRDRAARTQPPSPEEAG